MKDFILIAVAIILAIALGVFITLYYSKEEVKPPELIYVPGEPQIEYRDTTIYLWKEKPVESKGDTLYSDFDSTFVSLGDTISLGAIVEIYKDTVWWTVDIEHKHTEKYRVDTIKVPYETVVQVPIEIGGLDFLSYILGISTAILIWIITLL